MKHHNLSAIKHHNFSATWRKLFILSLLCCYLNLGARQTVDLSGTWEYCLTEFPDSLQGLAPDRGSLTLPGTLDTNKAGIPVAPSRSTDNLSRRYSYVGPAVYSRYVTIPSEAAGKKIALHLERTRPTSIKVDGIDAGYHSVVSAPQTFDLSSLLTPGKHLIEITVDNGDAVPAAVRNSSHSFTDATQTNWNGIIGDLKLIISEPMNISRVQLTSDIAGRAFIIDGAVAREDFRRPLTVTARSNGQQRTARISPDSPDEFSLYLPLGPSAELWSEWNPQLYDVELSLTDDDGRLLDTVALTSGLREFSTSGTHFTINGEPTFLRGRHDACVWPLTAHVPMDKESWQKYFSILKDYGINHVRFHSWCPPEACFAAADEAGFYLQPELTIWGEIDKDQAPLLDFLEADMEAIVSQYGHHPSFVMFAIGNELWGDTSIMKDCIDKARDMQPGLLATYGSNIYLGYQGHIDGEDFLVTCRVGDGEGYSTHARASFSFADALNGGIMNSTYPNSVMNFSDALKRSPVPVVGHETGQYQIYPDFSGIKKYKGALRPDNLTEFRNQAQEAGTLRKADKFAKASGAWASRLYKADMEMNLRTPEMGGFQLLDIQDYPGQGTALVGILDPFMDSKGIITPEDWRESCSDLTILAELPRFTYSAGETLDFDIITVNYSPANIGGDRISWSLPFDSGDTNVMEGKGVTFQKSVQIKLPDVKEPQKVELKLSLYDDSKSNRNTATERRKGASQGKAIASNKYDLWIYPSETKPVKGVALTTNIDEALELLEQGERVILTPDSATVASTSLPPLFQTDYWNYRMFLTICQKVGATPSPGTLGLLINDSHPAFEYFPTDSHTNWQWFDIVRNSRPLIIDRLPVTIDPIVEPIDNVDRNYRLALLLECSVGKGKLLIAMVDLEKAATSPEGRWLRYSLEKYVASKRFKPSLSLTPRQLTDLLTIPSLRRTLKELRNISYE